MMCPFVSRQRRSVNLTKIPATRFKIRETSSEVASLSVLGETALHIGNPVLQTQSKTNTTLADRHKAHDAIIDSHNKSTSKRPQPDSADERAPVSRQ